MLKLLKRLEVSHLPEKELERILYHLKEVTLYWRSHGHPDWGIEGLVIRGMNRFVLVS